MEVAAQPHELRPEQVDVAGKIGERLGNGENIALNGPTGIGKSVIGCGCATFMHTPDNGPVCYAVHTKRLQDQVFEDANRATGGQAAILYGKSNYVCGTRFKKFVREGTYEQPRIGGSDVDWLMAPLVIELLQCAQEQEVHSPEDWFRDRYIQTALKHSWDESHTEILSKQATYIFSHVCCEKDCCSSCTGSTPCGIRVARKRFATAQIGIVNYDVLMCHYLYGVMRIIVPGRLRLVCDEADQQIDAMRNQLDARWGFQWNGKFADSTLDDARRLGCKPEGVDDLFRGMPLGLAFDPKTGCSRGEARRAFHLLGRFKCDIETETLKREAVLFRDGGQLAAICAFCLARGTVTMHVLESMIRGEFGELPPHYGDLAVQLCIHTEADECEEDRVSAQLLRRATDDSEAEQVARCIRSLVKCLVGPSEDDVRGSTYTWKRYKHHTPQCGLVDDEALSVHRAIRAVLSVCYKTKLARSALAGYKTWKEACHRKDSDGVCLLYPEIAQEENEDGTTTRCLRIAVTEQFVRQEQRRFYEHVHQAVFMSATLITRFEQGVPHSKRFDEFRAEIGGQVDMFPVYKRSTWDYSSVRLTYGSTVGHKTKKNGWVRHADMDSRARSEFDSNVREIVATMKRLRADRTPVMLVLSPSKQRLGDMQRALESHLQDVHHLWYWNEKNLASVPDKGNHAARPMVVYGSNNLAVGVDKEIDAVVLLQFLKDTWPGAEHDFAKLLEREHPGAKYQELIQACYHNKTTRRTIQGCGRLVRAPPNETSRWKALMVFDSDCDMIKRIQKVLPGVRSANAKSRHRR